VGGVKDSWIVPLFILTADFAEALPTDEDPMPIDGNPHPMSGNLHQFEHLFVSAQYPEIGWNMNHVVEEQGGQQNQNHEHMQHDNIAEQ
jgi:hypothetical protein